MRAIYISNAEMTSGVGLRACQVARRLENRPGLELRHYRLDGGAALARLDDREVLSLHRWPGRLGSKPIGWIRLGRTLAGRFELDGSAAGRPVYHLTNQTLSFLARRLKPAVVTVHDLIDVLSPQVPWSSLVSRYLYRGLSEAAHLICVSQYTAATLREYYHVPSEKISVIYNGLDDTFHHIPGFSSSSEGRQLRLELGLSQSARIVLYVGSEHPRKNLEVAIEAFRNARQRLHGEVCFLKVGEAGSSSGRRRLLRCIERHGLRDAVRFLGLVEEVRLNELYNLANVLVYPSTLEGFGMPPLQAMAAGLPVIASNHSSLPEVVGDQGRYGPMAALVRSGHDIGGWTEDLLAVLTNPRLATDLRNKGWVRARRFSWERTALEEAAVLDRVHHAFRA